MRLIDADELMEHVWRDELDSRAKIAKMINNAPTVKDIPANIPIDILYKVFAPKPNTDVLDKIRSEIKEIYNDRPYSYNHSQRTELFREVLKIIDKYRGGTDQDGQ